MIKHLLFTKKHNRPNKGDADNTPVLEPYYSLSAALYPNTPLSRAVLIGALNNGMVISIGLRIGNRLGLALKPSIYLATRRSTVDYKVTYTTK